MSPSRADAPVRARPPGRAPCPCPIDCHTNRSLSRRLFTLAWPQSCSLKRTTTPRAAAPPAALALLGLAAGWATGQSHAVRWLLLLLPAGIAGWVLLLRRARIVPWPAAAAILGVQTATAAALVGWASGLGRGMAAVDLSLWALLATRSAWRKRARAGSLAGAALLGMVAAQLASPPGVAPLLTEAGGAAAGCALLAVAGKRRPGLPHGLYDTGYLSTI